MIDLYSYATPNGLRVSIMLEEAAIPYRLHRVDLQAGHNRDAGFLELNPAARIPVIVDPQGPGHQPITLTQSTAILVYLAEKSNRFVGADAQMRVHVLEALAMVMTDVAPASANLFYMPQASETPDPDVIAFCKAQFLDILGHLDHHLGRHHYLAHEVSIADFALYPTIARRRDLLAEASGLGNLHRWFEEMGLRPGVSRGMAVAR